MELQQDKINLIEKIIKNDRKFANNEDLYDDFFNETCKRSLLIVKSVTSDATLEAYLKKIATTSILNVLKNEGRLRRTSAGFRATQDISLDSGFTDFSKKQVEYKTIVIDQTPEDIVIKKEILQRIMDAVCEIDKNSPNNEYSKIYYLRFEKCLTQKEIASELNLSQSEISKRLFKLMNEVRQVIM